MTDYIAQLDWIKNLWTVWFHYLPVLSCISQSKLHKLVLFAFPSLYLGTSYKFRAFFKKNTQVIFNFLTRIGMNKNYSYNFYSTWICFSLFKFQFFYNVLDSATSLLWVYCLKAPEEIILCLTWLSDMYTIQVNIIYLPPRHSASQIRCFIYVHVMTFQRLTIPVSSCTVVVAKCVKM